MNEPKRKLKRICVRCESKENISLYLHKTPPASKTRYGKRYIKITVYEGTGGTGYTPVCEQCKRLFSRWKVLVALAKSFFIAAWIAFPMYLLFLILNPYPFASSETKFTYLYVPTVLSGVFLFIFGLCVFYIEFRSAINPHKFVLISSGGTIIKPLNAEEWIPIPRVDS